MTEKECYTTTNFCYECSNEKECDYHKWYRSAMRHSRWSIEDKIKEVKELLIMLPFIIIVWIVVLNIIVLLLKDN